MTAQPPKPNRDTVDPTPVPQDTDFTAEGAPPPGRVVNTVPATVGASGAKPQAPATRSANRNANRKGPPARKGW